MTGLAWVMWVVTMAVAGALNQRVRSSGVIEATRRCQRNTVGANLGAIVFASSAKL